MINFSVENEIIYSTEVLQSKFCDYNDAYILEKGDITIIGRNLATEVAFKSFAPFTKCITKINETAINDAEDLNLLYLYKGKGKRFTLFISNK